MRPVRFTDIAQTHRNSPERLSTDFVRDACESLFQVEFHNSTGNAGKDFDLLFYDKKYGIEKSIQSGRMIDMAVIKVTVPRMMNCAWYPTDIEVAMALEASTGISAIAATVETCMRAIPGLPQP